MPQTDLNRRDSIFHRSWSLKWKCWSIDQKVFHLLAKPPGPPLGDTLQRIDGKGESARVRFCAADVPQQRELANEQILRLVGENCVKQWRTFMNLAAREVLVRNTSQRDVGIYVDRIPALDLFA
ncbi:unnamed protein product [Amoebophrya sp. A25]|nr:unnamed protein product [Amoebophrya sp. A25]|eukprot:GSA25T00024045001.1